MKITDIITTEALNELDTTQNPADVIDPVDLLKALTEVVGTKFAARVNDDVLSGFVTGLIIGVTLAQRAANTTTPVVEDQVAS